MNVELYGLKYVKRIDLSKIDVQSAELDVLKGSHDILEKDKPSIVGRGSPSTKYMVGNQKPCIDC